MNYVKALEYATEMHGTTPVRIGGEKYITHPVAVADDLRNKGFSTEVQIIGLFHDLLEDTDATKKEIIALSNHKVYNIVLLLTKEEGYSMDDYMSRIQNNKLATAVKLADRNHNLRCSLVADEEFRMKYYKESYEYYKKLVENSSKDNRNIFLNDFNKAMSQLNKTFKNRVKVMGYGSLMNKKDFMRMFSHDEQQTITKLGNGVFTGHKLAYTYDSKMRKGGVLDVISGSLDDYVIGVVNEMPHHLMVRELDAREGHPTLYKREFINVAINGQKEIVYCYFVLDHRRNYSEIAPHDDYHNIVLAGMVENGFPEAYIKNYKKHVSQLNKTTE